VAFTQKIMDPWLWRRSETLTDAVDRCLAGGPGPAPQVSVTPQRVWRFIEADVIPRERELLASSDEHIAGRVRDLQDRARKAGLWALPMPVELGGGGLPLAEYVGTGEIVGRSWFGPFVVGTSNLPAVWMLRRFGSPEVRDHYLPNLAADRCAIELQMGEPDRHPTNPLHVRTVGLSVDGDWIVRGNKASSCAAGESVAAVLCRTENESLLLHRSFSLILVPASAGQQRHGPASGIGEANYRDVRVAKESLVGDRGDGLSVTRLWLRLSGLVDAIHGIGDRTTVRGARWCCPSATAVCARKLYRHPGGPRTAAQRRMPDGRRR
jgi:acyl-CoA dehydrogenase